KTSLIYLHKFPISRIKIYKLFIREMTNDRARAAIVRAIVALAHELSLEVVAEGVEAQQEVDFLIGCGCDYMQGYLISEPLPAEEALKLIESRD
ncbi:MAG: EAL domain-containing protein, partial [Thermoanaerobaculia bacterium]|nr:EAL domain-containing protein [Thermoanaerobaculia bacterium]